MVVECEDEEYLDLFNPESLEYFHQMRYIMLNKSLAVDPEYKYHNAAVADRLNVNVLAPTDTVWAYPDGTLTVGPTADSNTGEWVVVSPNSSPKNPNK